MDWPIHPVKVQSVKRQPSCHPRCKRAGTQARNPEVGCLAEPAADRKAVWSKFVTGVLITRRINTTKHVPRKLRRGETVGDFNRPELVDDRIQDIAGKSLQCCDSSRLHWKVRHPRPSPCLAYFDQVAKSKMPATRLVDVVPGHTPLLPPPLWPRTMPASTKRRFRRCKLGPSPGCENTPRS